MKLLLGLDPRVDLQIDPRLQGPTVTELKGVNLEDQADNQRPEVREARAEVADSERKLVLAKYGLWPALDLVGHYAQQGFGESFGDSFNLDRTEWNVGFRSSVPLDRTIQKAALTEAEIALRSRERNYRQLRGQVVGQVRQAVRQLDRARAESELAARIATQASQQEELARYRYEKGPHGQLRPRPGGGTAHRGPRGSDPRHDRPGGRRRRRAPGHGHAHRRLPGSTACGGSGGS